MDRPAGWVGSVQVTKATYINRSGHHFCRSGWVWKFGPVYNSGSDISDTITVVMLEGHFVKLTRKSYTSQLAVSGESARFLSPV